MARMRRNVQKRRGSQARTAWENVWKNRNYGRKGEKLCRNLFITHLQKWYSEKTQKKKTAEEVKKVGRKQGVSCLWWRQCKSPLLRKCFRALIIRIKRSRQPCPWHLCQIVGMNSTCITAAYDSIPSHSPISFLFCVLYLSAPAVSPPTILF